MRGFAVIPLLIVIVFASVAIFIVPKLNNLFPPAYTPKDTNNPQKYNATFLTPYPASSSPTRSQTKITPSKLSPTTVKSKSPTPTTRPNFTATPTTTQTNNSSCSYNLNGPTGAIKIILKPNSGNVIAMVPQGELKAIAGCKVLDGRYTDTQTMWGRVGNTEIIFSSVPPGPYSVRVSYNGVWSNPYGIGAVGAQSTSVEIPIAGSQPSPTPTSAPKPICTVSAMPSSSGTAPYAASVCVGNNSNPYQAVQQEFADYDGNGSWDYQGASFGCHSYTFQTAGTYTPKAKIVSANGESDVCQTTVTVN